MKKIDEEIINDIKDKNDIVDVMSEYISLVKKGKNYICLCPFHNDSNPSMVVSQEKQIYKCFSCGAGGNVITFVQNYEKVSFIQALDKLAQRSGINLGLENTINEKIEEYSDYYSFNMEALSLFTYLLDQTTDHLALDYLEKRKISTDIKEKFKIGYGGMNNVLTKLYESKNYDLNKAVELGVVNLNNNTYHDTYQNRLIFPIINEYDKIVGFSARALGNIEPKYLNSIESRVFDKSKLLYNINNAKKEISSTKTVYILEGPNDVIAFDKAGIENAVCVMGTAFSKSHLQVLKKFRVNQIILGFDGDSAGKNATYKTIQLLLKEKINLKYLDFEEYDPDEYLNKYGYQKFIETINKPLSALEFKMKYDFTNINTNNYQEKKDLTLKLVDELKMILDEFDKEYYYNFLANLSGISFEVINSYASKISNNTMYNQKTSTITNSGLIVSEIDNAAENILFFIMHDRKYFNVFNKEIGNFIHPTYRKLANIVSAYYLNNVSFDISKIDDLTNDNQMISELMRILLSFNFEIYHNAEIFDDCIETIKYENLYFKKEKLENEMKNIMDPLAKVDISSEIIEITRELNDLKSKKFNK